MALPDMLGQPVACTVCMGRFALLHPLPQPLILPFAIPPPKPHAPPLPQTCPLCRQATHMHVARALYGQWVCWHCFAAFAKRRQLACLLDVMGILLLGFSAGLLFGAVASFAGMAPGMVSVVTTLLSWLLLPLWFCKDCFDGQSVGKALCGVRVIDETTGVPCGISTSFKRNLPLIIPFMPLIAGIQLCKGHRTGDSWSNTKVVWKKYADHPIFAPAKVLKLSTGRMAAATSETPANRAAVPDTPPCPAASIL